jgi:hypothetical protein
LRTARQPTWRSDLSAVQHDSIGAGEVRAEVPDRQQWIEEDEARVDLLGHAVDPRPQRTRGRQHPLASADHSKGLRRVPSRVAHERRRQDGGLRRR